MRTILYFLLFALSLIAAFWSGFAIHLSVNANTDEFILLPLLTIISLGGSILFGYLFFNELKNNGL